MNTQSNLSGRALAEAAAKVMGWAIEDGYPAAIYVKKPGKILPIAWDVPDRSVSSDYECLEWARKNFKGARLSYFAELVYETWWGRNQDSTALILEYQPGDYARALVAAAGGGDEQPNPAQ